MRFRRLVPAVASLLLAVSVTACSDGDDASGRPDQAWLEPALLTVEDLGSGFQVAPDDERDGGGAPDFGCLFDFDVPGAGQRDRDNDDGEPEAEFQAVDDPQLPMVLHSITDSGDGDKAAELLQKLGEQTGKCTEVDETDESGMRWQFDVEQDEETWAPGADQQLTVTASGTAALAPMTIPISFALTIVRTGDVLTFVMFFDMADDVTDAHRSLVERACERVDAVIAGGPLPDREPLLEDYPIGKFLSDLLGGTATGPQTA
ncbi:hypothetical protein [Nocardioides alcanivorans]|uniref:hypothetical protein n=1 Tax=Nocardioides alcanivorans TaxID=2897352 RepID=UPI001F279206|nr:hypothetical protein [Nocardioides alcanivorans]